ncbi:MAG: tail fiber protein [Spirochaetes bacterium]|nr:tail fiber protein [Spirochaetota bacterium]
MGNWFRITDRLAFHARSVLSGRWRPAAFAALLVFTGFAVFADDMRIPNVFQPGDVISAERINENFSVLHDQVDRLRRDVRAVPLGTILPFAGKADYLPDGWLLCDGRELGRSAFPELFAVIGTLWGDGNGVTTFNLPDLRGLFLRGVNHGRSGAFSDPDAAQRVNDDGSIVGDRVGSFQDDIFCSHNHPPFPGYYAIGQLKAGDDNNADNGESQPGSAREGSPSATGWSGGNETRPVNAAVNYIIKVE